MTRVLFSALALAVLACTAKPQDPPADGKANADSKGDPKAEPPKAEPEPAPKICTEMACRDSATIDTKLTAAGATLGKHEFAIELDGVAQACTVEFTDVTQIAYGTCSGDASVWLGPNMRTVEVPSEIDGVVSAKIEPIAGEFAWQVSVSGTPAKVHVIHSHAGKVVLDQTAEFASYSEYRPNGEGCEPVCKTAKAEWKGP